MDYKYDVPERGRFMQWPMPDKFKASEPLRDYYQRTIGKRTHYIVRCFPGNRHSMEISAAPGVGPWIKLDEGCYLPKGWH